MTMLIDSTCDPLLLASRSMGIAGRLDHTCLPRLLDILAEPKVEIEVNIDFTMDRPGSARAKGVIKGVMSLCCQRCLAHYDEAVELDFDAAFVPQSKADGDDDVELDEEGRIEIRALIEDDLILAVPLIPRHPEGQCEDDVIAKYLVDDVAEPEPLTQRPFAGALSGLITKTKD